MANSTQEAFRPMWTSLPRLLLLAAAVVFCAATTLYALSWMYDQRHPLPHPVEIGFNQSRDTFFDQRSKSIPVYNVTAGSPAEKAGLRGGDQITALNGHALTSYALFDKVWTRSRPGDAVEITVHRAGTGEPLTFRAIFRPVSADSVPEGAARASVREILNFYPIFFLLVGFAVLFLRLEDPHAWLVGLLFTGFVAVPNFASPVALPDALKVFASLYRTVFFSIITPLFYIFFALFPEKSPLERRAPWLKSVALAIGACLLFPGLSYGDAHLPSFVGRTIGENGEEYLRRTLTYGLLVLGIISLLWNCISQETLRKRDANREYCWQARCLEYCPL
jgi:hypothetical protein